MQTTASSSSTSANARTAAVNQPTHSLLFKLPLEVRMEIYSYLFTKTIVHVEAIHPFIINGPRVRVFPALEHLSDTEKKTLSHLERSMQSGQDIVHSNMPDSRVLDLATGVSSSGLFTMYRCATTKPLKSVSACPPGYCDHVDCGKIREEPAHTFPLACRQAYFETSDLTKAFNSHAALQFASLQDFMAFSMLLSDNQRENIRNIRLNLSSSSTDPLKEAPEWLYFCSVFATPSDRMCIQHHFEYDYPNHQAEVSFHYNYSSRDLELNDPVLASTSCWVRPHTHLGLQDFDSSWSVATDLWRLRARVPLSVRLSSCSGRRTKKSISTMTPRR
jgi:hypothetical protein